MSNNRRDCPRGFTRPDVFKTKQGRPDGIPVLQRPVTGPSLINGVFALDRIASTVAVDNIRAHLLEGTMPEILTGQCANCI